MWVPSFIKPTSGQDCGISHSQCCILWLSRHSVVLYDGNCYHESRAPYSHAAMFKDSIYQKQSTLGCVSKHSTAPSMRITTDLPGGVE